MGKQFEIEFVQDGTVVAADLLEAKAPLSCEALWQGLAEPHRDVIHHGRETGPELWCFVQHHIIFVGGLDVHLDSCISGLNRKRYA